MTPRQWHVLVHVREGELAVSISADAQLLMPILECRAPDEVMEYVEGALVDFRRGDTLAGVLSAGTRTLTSCVVPSRDMALNWLAPALVEAWHGARSPASQYPPASSASTGVMRKVGGRDEAGDETDAAGGPDLSGTA